jgi:hypothetical protein
MKAKIKLYSIESSTCSFTHHIVVKIQKSKKKIKKEKKKNLDYTYLLSSSSPSSFLQLQPETLEKLLVIVKMLA